MAAFSSAFRPTTSPRRQNSTETLDENNAWGITQMMQTLDVGAASLPIIWDADFLYGPRTASGEDTYVLCEN